jgi:hypothetical protein
MNMHDDDFDFKFAMKMMLIMKSEKKMRSNVFLVHEVT